MFKEMESLSKEMLALEPQSNDRSWKTLSEITERDLLLLLNRYHSISDRLRENCRIINSYSNLISIEFIYDEFLRYLIKEYTYKRLLLRHSGQSLKIATQKVQVKEPMAINEAEKTKGHLLLLFHFGNYLESMVALSQYRKVTFAKRRQTTDLRYKSLFLFLKKEFGFSFLTTFDSILKGLLAGKEILLLPDNAHFTRPEKNKIYSLGPIKLSFNGATDELIRRSQCKVSCLYFENNKSGTKIARFQQIAIKNSESGLQNVLDNLMSKQILQAPWEWDRLKYLHKIIHLV